MKIMDLDSFLDEMDNDNDVVKMVIAELINLVDKQIPLMKELIKKSDYNVLNREAHSIKGGARNIMADGLEFYSAELEKAASLKDHDKSEELLDMLDSEFARFKNFAHETLHLAVS